MPTNPINTNIPSHIIMLTKIVKYGNILVEIGSRKCIDKISPYIA